MTTFVSWKEWHCQFYNKKYEEQNNHLIESIASNVYIQSQNESKGISFVRRMVYTMNNLRDFDLYDYQLDVIKMFLPTQVEKIYGKRYTLDKKSVLKEQGYSQDYNEMLFTAARRFGKTFVLALFAIAIMCNTTKTPGESYKVAVFATSDSNAKLFIKECNRQWKQLPADIRERYTKTENATSIRLVNENDPEDVREMTSFPGSGTVRF